MKGGNEHEVGGKPKGGERWRQHEDEERGRVLKLTGERKKEKKKERKKKRNGGELYSSTAMIVISFVMNREGEKRERFIYIFPTRKERRL